MAPTRRGDRPRHHCGVCNSPSASTLHFGARSCKACAAFFRRTVALDMKYKCSAEIPHRCSIIFTMRMICRACRFEKCLRAGMKEEHVQSKAQQSGIMKRSSSYVDAHNDDLYSTTSVLVSPLRKCLSDQTLTEDSISDRQFKALTENSISDRHSHKALTEDSISDRQFKALTEDSVFDRHSHKALTENSVFDRQFKDLTDNSSKIIRSTVLAYSPRNIHLSPDSNHLLDMDRLNDIKPHFQSSPSSNFIATPMQIATTSSPPRASSTVSSVTDTSIISSDQTKTASNQLAYGIDVIHRLVVAERNLNDRRRVLYTDRDVTDLLESNGECPYTQADLRPMDLNKFIGLNRSDLVFVFDYVRALPGFQLLSSNDKRWVYRCSIGLDTTMTTAYLSMCLGVEYGRLVFVNGSYLQMDPLPPIELANLVTEGDRIRFNAYMPFRKRQYWNLCKPFAEMKLSQLEFAALKALSLWHVSHFKLSTEGRVIGNEQREAIFHGLHEHMVSLENGCERLGNLILLMSSVFEIYNEMREHYVKISFFDIVKLDPLLKQVIADAQLGQ